MRGDLVKADLTKARLREAKPTKAFERPGHRLSDHDVPIDEDDPTADRDVGQGGRAAPGDVPRGSAYRHRSSRGVDHERMAATASGPSVPEIRHLPARATRKR
jgi:hypothetical protein